MKIDDDDDDDGDDDDDDDEMQQIQRISNFLIFYLKFFQTAGYWIRGRGFRGWCGNTVHNLQTWPRAVRWRPWH